MPVAENSFQAIDRAFLVLETIAHTGAMSLAELHKALNINKPALFRIVQALCNNGYLLRDEKTGSFSLSLKAFEIGVHAVRSLNYMSLVKSVLRELSTELGVIAQFSVDDHNELLCLESIDINNTGFSVYTRVGERSGLYSTSAGKALLSLLPNDEILQKFDKMTIRALTPNTITTPDALLQDIAKTRTRGYALDLEENEPGLFCIGVPLMGYNGTALGAISLSGRSMTPEDEQRLSTMLVSSSQRLSTMLGYTSH